MSHSRRNSATFRHRPATMTCEALWALSPFQGMNTPKVEPRSRPQPLRGSCFKAH
jgi:hypothetical protein